jgi:type II secretory pathway predicted ATPase ExeA
MYYKYFGFEELPFSVTPDPRFFYCNAVYQEVLAGLDEGIPPRNAFMVITGEAGIGKTTLLHRLISSSADSIEYILLINPCLNVSALLRTILKDLGLPNSATDKQTLLEQLHSHVREQFTKGRTVALLFDEAQGLTDEVLEELRLLHDAGNSEIMMPIVLMGQPELDSRLDESKLRQVKECITLRRRLVSLPDHDVYPYLASRLEHAGYHGNELFEPAAIERLTNQSSGIPRLINIICDNALLLAYRASEHRVTAAMIDEVAKQLLLVERPPRMNPVMRLPIDYDASTVLPIVARQIDEFATRTQFVDQHPSGNPDRAPTVEETISAEPVEARLTVDDFDTEDIGRLTPSLTDEFDQPAFVDRFPSQEQTTVPENDQPEKLEKISRLQSGVGHAGNRDDETEKEDRNQLSAVDQTGTVVWGYRQLTNVSKLGISIGALMVLIVLAWGWVEFYPRNRDGALPAGDGQVANTRKIKEDPHRPTTIEKLEKNLSIPGDAESAAFSQKPVDEAVSQSRAKETPQPLLTSPPNSPAIRQDADQNHAGAPEKQESVEVTNAGNRGHPPPQEIYRVSGASFLRNRPAADAEIIDTLQPGTRIAVTNRAGEYFRVRSLRDEKVSGFVHKEDAFFERIQ